MIYIYLAENLLRGEFNLDEDEYIETERYTLTEAVDMIFNGVITDSKTMIAVLAYKALKNL